MMKMCGVIYFLSGFMALVSCMTEFSGMTSTFFCQNGTISPKDIEAVQINASVATRVKELVKFIESRGGAGLEPEIDDLHIRSDAYNKIGSFVISHFDLSDEANSELTFAVEGGARKNYSFKLIYDGLSFAQERKVSHYKLEFRSSDGQLKKTQTVNIEYLLSIGFEGAEKHSVLPQGARSTISIEQPTTTLEATITGYVYDSVIAHHYSLQYLENGQVLFEAKTSYDMRTFFICKNEKVCQG